MAFEKTRMRRARRDAFLIWALAACLALLCASLLAVPAAAASGPADSYASELARLLNGERTRRGLSALPVDPTLAKKARDGSIACPGEPSKVMQGRARDLAIYGTGGDAHHLRLCPEHTVLDVMPSWGYSRPVGEVIVWNLNYGSRSPSAARDGLMSSSSHRSIILGSFGRFGCGAWRAANNTIYYVCLYAARGPALRATPRPATPRPATPRPTPPPATPRPAATAIPTGESDDVRPTAAPSAGADADATDPAAPAEPSATAPERTLEVAGVIATAEPSRGAENEGADLVPATGAATAGDDPIAVLALLALAVLALGLAIGAAIVFRDRLRRS